jgi:hypothetical protein
MKRQSWPRRHTITAFAWMDWKTHEIPQDSRIETRTEDISNKSLERYLCTITFGVQENYTMYIYMTLSVGRLNGLVPHSALEMSVYVVATVQCCVWGGAQGNLCSTLFGLVAAIQRGRRYSSGAVRDKAVVVCNVCKARPGSPSGRPEVSDQPTIGTKPRSAIIIRLVFLKTNYNKENKGEPIINTIYEFSSFFFLWWGGRSINICVKDTSRLQTDTDHFLQHRVC